MSQLYAEDFEGSFPGGWTKAGTQQALSTQDATVANTGSKSYKVDTTGASGSSELSRTSVTAGKMFVIRLYVRLDTAPGATATIWSCANASGNLTLNITTGRILRIAIGVAALNGAVTMTLGQWYRVDMRFDTTGATATVDWQINGSAQTQVTNAQASANMTSHLLGLVNATTMAAHFDDVSVNDSSAAYPIGAIGRTGTGSFSGSASLSSVGAKTGTGAGFESLTITLTPTGARTSIGAGSLTAALVGSPSGSKAVRSAGAVTGTASFTRTATKATTGTGNVTVTLGESPSGSKAAAAGASLSLGHTMSGTGSSSHPGGSSIGAVLSFADAGRKATTGTGTLSDSATGSATGIHATSGVGPAIALTATETATAHKAGSGSGSIADVEALLSQGGSTRQGMAVLDLAEMFAAAGLHMPEPGRTTLRVDRKASVTVIDRPQGASR